MRRLRIRMHGEKGCTQSRNTLDALGDGCADVVQLEIEKDTLAGAHQRLGEWKTSGECQLIADLVERDGVAEAIDHCVGARDRREIEGEDQAIARIVHSAPLHFSVASLRPPLPGLPRDNPFCEVRTFLQTTRRSDPRTLQSV